MSMSTQVRSQTITWTAIDDARADPLARLVGTVAVGGVRLHLDAFAVTARDGVQVAACDVDQEEFDAASLNVDGRAGPYATLEIRGRPYAVFAACELVSLRGVAAGGKDPR